MSPSRDALYQELALKNEVQVEGIVVPLGIFDGLPLGETVLEQVHTTFAMDREAHVGVLYPAAFYLPHGLVAEFRQEPASPFGLRREGDLVVLTRQGKDVTTIDFLERPAFYGRQTSDGVWMGTVANAIPDGCLIVCYSNECSLKDKGQDCLYCNINATAETYGEAEGIFWKTARQIGETIAAGFAEGAGDHVTITGGFIPERREVEYYFDVAEEIKNRTGLDDFNGTAVVGAPLDFGVIEKYKEIGYRTIAMNIEVWNKHLWRGFCPGKHEVCGGWENWVKALERSAEVFGHGRVRSNIVGGLESKDSTLEGVDYLASKGVINFVGAWCPNPGSALEGHRTPEAAWHLDLAYRTAAIFRRNGFTYEQLYDAAPGSAFLMHDIYKIEDGLFDGGRQKPLGRIPVGPDAVPAGHSPGSSGLVPAGF